MMYCSAVKAGGRRSKWRCSVMAFVFPSNCYVQWSPAFLKMVLNTCLLKGSGE